MKRIKINARRIPQEKRFITRELSKEVTKVLEHDHCKMMRHVTVNQQGHNWRAQPQFDQISESKKIVNRGKFIGKL